jgi:hypothetical protein
MCSVLLVVQLLLLLLPCVLAIERMTGGEFSKSQRPDNQSSSSALLLPSPVQFN